VIVRVTPIAAILPLLTTALLLIVLVLSSSTAFYWPLAAGAIVAAGLALRAGFRPRQLGRAALDGMKSTLIALSILIVVGGLIGVWKAAGTVPALIYYGLSLAKPHLIVPMAFVLSLATSMMLGTSVGTLSTLGVAIMGVAHGIGAPPALVAGALVSGALFGDRSSPLAGSLNLNVAMTGTQLRRMLSFLAPTGVTAAGLCLGLYALLGARVAVAAGTGGEALRAAIAAHFTISPWLLLPPVVVLLLAFLRVPVRWALGVGILAGAAMAGLVGGREVIVPLKAALFGFQVQTGDGALDQMLAGGGIVPMKNQVILILTAGAFNGIMEATGMMSLVVSRLVEGLRRPLHLIGASMLISIAVAMVAANQALAIIVPGRMLRPTFERSGLDAELLARALADSGTVLAGIIPWNLMGMLAAAALGVPVRAFAPYAFFALVLPLVSVVKTVLEDRRRASRSAYPAHLG
jgi:NhaC family Na+:H+ antiporter